MPEKPSRPNILLLMADQWRYDYLGSAGAEFLRTPNLDRLAERGMLFTHCCTNSPVCAPARIALATGLQPTRLGALDNHSFLPHTVPTYYQRLRDRGYRVGCVGKLDLAKPDGYNGRYGDRPCVFGWGFTHPEECEGKMHAGRKPHPQGPYTYWLQEQGLLGRFHEDYTARQARGWIIGASHDSVLPTEAFEDVYIGRRAVEWIENVPDDFPWHFFVSFVGPHDPFDPPTEYAERHRRADVPEPIEISAAPRCRRVEQRRREHDREEVRRTRRQYGAAIEVIDDQVGRILDALERRGLADGTIVLFSSDHGEMLGDHGLYTKSVAYEAALRVPLIVAGPGIEPQRTSDRLIELIDLNPTLCELAGLAPQEDIDARSICPLLRGEARRHRSEIVSALRGLRCIRTGRYKLIDNYNDIPELYDLQEDPHELTNAAADHPKLVRELLGRLQQRMTEGKWLR
jgi:choline-sulfatase